MVSFEVTVEPRPAPRPRLGKATYMPRDYQVYKETIATLAKVAMRGTPPLSERVAVELIFRRRFKSSSRRFGDIDNLVKGVLDALNGIIFVDDALVTKVTASKVQSENVGLTVKVLLAEI